MPAYVYKLPTFPYNFRSGKVLQLAAAAMMRDSVSARAPQRYRAPLATGCLAQQLLAIENKAKSKLYAKQHPRGWLKNNKFDLEK